MSPVVKTSAENLGVVDVFISYRRADKEFAHSLFELLTRRGVVAWYDQLIPPGADWRDTIAQHLARSRLMLVVLSSRALESKELKKELAVADLENVPLLAVRIEDVKPREAFAYELARGNWFDTFPDPDARIRELGEYLETLSKEPEKIPKALERSLAARQERPRWEARRAVRLGWLLILLCLLLSGVEFALYEALASPTQRLLVSGVGAFPAFSYVLFATTLGSPLMAFSILRGGITGGEVPLLVVAVANTFALLILAKHVAARLTARFCRTARQPEN